MYRGTLKEFQVEGCDFLFKKKRTILAFDVGLGKTHVAMAVAEKLKECRGVSKILVFCPSYLKWKWAAEIEAWTDASSTVIEGTLKQREKLYAQYEKDYLIVNYEMLLQDYKTILDFNFDVVIADEVTKIKTFNSKTKKTVNQYRSEYRWGLTGTPISNKPDELFSIMGWIDGKLFGKWVDFNARYIMRDWFGGVQEYVNLRELAEVASSRMISKTQEEVGAELPEVIIENLPLSFTPKQKKVYGEIAASLEQYLDTMVGKLLAEDNTNVEEQRIRERFSALRMACISPVIMTGSKAHYAQSLGCSDIGAKIPAAQQLIEEKIMGTEDKMVIFSFYRMPVTLLAEWLDKKGIGHKVLMGGMNAKETQANIMEFSTNPSCQIFLTTEAGNKGIDLQAAKYLINLDIPFSWEGYEQRIGRIKRIGSVHKTAIVYNLIMKDSFEERLLDKVTRKGLLSEAIRGKNDLDSLVPQEQSLRQFLKGEL